MDINNRTELLLQVWVELDEMKNLTSAVIKGLDYEIHMEMEEMRSILHIIKKKTEDIITEISEKLV